MTTILIRGAQVVNEGTVEALDVLVDGGRIAQVAASLDTAADTVIDGSGKWLLPGMIDDQVHFREPGNTHKADIASESAAAVAGGITSFMDMPNTNPPTLNAQALADKKAIAAKGSLANYAFHLGVSNDNMDDVASIDPKSVSGVKVFLGASTGNMLVDNPEILERLFECVPTILLAHCEDTPMIEAAEQAWKDTHGGHPPLSEHPNIRSAEACYKSSSMATELARKHGTRLHVLHLTTARELALFSNAPLAEKHITAEVCVHHLSFDDRDYAQLGTHLKCNPAVKSVTDRDALRQAVADGVIDVIGTDHAPHTLAEKDAEYFDAPAGLPLVQHAVPALMELVDKDVFDLQTMVAKTSHKVAELFDVKDRGYIREGYWADLILVGERPADAPEVELFSKCGWSPFVGRSFKYEVATTIVSGQVAWHDGKLNRDCRGEALEFDR